VNEILPSLQLLNPSYSQNRVAKDRWGNAEGSRLRRDR